MVNQMAVFMENRKGRILQLSTVLRENDIDLLSLSIADTKDFGILRCVVRDNDKAQKVLREAGFTVTSTDLIGVLVKNEPGGLENILTILDEKDFNIEYLYSHNNKGEKTAMIFLKVTQEQEAIALLKERGVTLLEQDML